MKCNRDGVHEATPSILNGAFLWPIVFQGRPSTTVVRAHVLPKALPSLALLVVHHLAHRGLAYINDGFALQPIRRDLSVRDLPRLWHARSTRAKDRKRMLRLLIKDITVEKSTDQKQLLLHIRWQGGAHTDLAVSLPLNFADRVRYSATLVEQVRELARSLPDAQIVEQLNREGQLSALAKPFTVSMIKWIRYRYHIPAAKLIRPGELTVRQVAERFGVSSNVVYYWIERGVIQARRVNSGMPCWVTLGETDEQKLCDRVGKSPRIQKGILNAV